MGAAGLHSLSFNLNGDLETPRGKGVWEAPPGDFGEFTTKIIHFRHISSEILPKTSKRVHYCMSLYLRSILAIILFKY